MQKRIKIFLPIILLVTALFVVASPFCGSLRIYSSLYTFLCGVLLAFQLIEKPKQYQITLALLFFLFAEVSTLVISSTHLNVVYQLINSFYILAYASIVHFLCQRLRVNKVLMKLRYFLLIPLCFAGYLMFYMTDIVYKDSMSIGVLRFIIETLYNLVVLALFVLSFINFMYYDSKKELLLFLSCMALVFSEIIQLTTIYIIQSRTLFVVLSVLKVLGLFSMYYYITLKKEENIVYGLLD